MTNGDRELILTSHGNAEKFAAIKTLANAAPVLFRDATDANPYLPYVAFVGIDMADVGNTVQLVQTIIHEFGHALGLPDVSERLGLIQGFEYVGVNAVREYQRFVPNATAVPL